MWSRSSSLVVSLAVVLGFLPAGSGRGLRAQQQETSDQSRSQELVLKTASTIEFSTDELTWPSVSVSPDGKTMVFDVLGDLYTLPIAGGTATRIVGGLSFESQPVFSPDGKTIAFLSDRTGVENLWIANADGSNPRAVSKDGLTRDRPEIMVSPSWTPDGQYIVVSKSRPPDPGTFWLFMYHRDGGSGVRIGAAPPPQPGPDAQGPPPPPPPNRMGAVVSPDGRFVYYAQRNGSFTYNARFPLWQIYRHDRETGDVAQVTNAQGSAMRPVLSPDGKFLVYGTRYKTDTGLRVRNLETGAERWLVTPVTRDDQESRASRDTLPGYAFMPDGKSLIVPIGGKLQRVDFETGQSRVIPMTVNVAAEIAPRVYTPVRVEDGPTVRARLVRWPALSPDGKRIVFSAMNRLYMMELPDGTPRLLTSAPAGSSAAEGEFMPTWSPDGRFIAYVTWTTTGGHIKRVRGGRRRAGDAEPVRGVLPGSRVYARRVEARVPRGRRGRSALRDHDEHPAGGRTAGRGCAGRDRRHQPAEHAGDPLDAIGRRRAHAGGVGAGWTRAAFRAQRLVAHLPHVRSRSAVDRHQRPRSSHAVPIQGSGPGNNPPSADEIRLSPDGSRAFVNLQGKHYLVPVPRAGRETVDIKIQGRADGTPVPVKRMSLEGGDYLRWSSDGATMTWALGAQFFRQTLDAAEPQKTTVVVELPRARPSGSVLLSGARVITMKGDEVMARGDVLVTGNRIAAIGAHGSLRPPAGTRTIDVQGKTIMPGLVDAHSHMWPPRGLHQTEIWQYMSNLAYGVTTTRDPQTSTPDVFAYADMVDVGMVPGPRSTRPVPASSRAPASRIATRRSGTSNATRRRTTPTRSSSTWPATGWCGSGSSKRARSTASRRRSKARWTSS